MTYIDQLKYVEFNSGPDVYLDKALVINFDTIHKSIKVLSTNSSFRTGNISRFILFISREKALSACFRCCRKDFHADKKLVLSNFLDK